MHLLLIRHARAEERMLNKRDRTRALTQDGRRRMHKAARGLRTLVPQLTHIATSPLLRARQTAEIVAAVYDPSEIVSLPALSPGAEAHDVLAWLLTQTNEAVFALVGHEPELSQLAGWLLSGKLSGFVQFKKGAAAFIEFAETPAAGKGKLEWLLTAAQLAALKV